MQDNGEGLTLMQSNALEVFEDQMGNVSEACRAVGISRQTWYRWGNESDEFSARVADIKEGLIDRSESALHRAIGATNVQAIMFHLKTKGRNRGYVERAPQEDGAASEDEDLMSKARQRVVTQYASEETANAE